jgi:hypothetical protein
MTASPGTVGPVPGLSAETAETGGPVLTMPGAPLAFHVMAKPTGAVCNLDCEYCFFLSKEMLYPGSRFRMAAGLQEAYIRQLLEAHARAPEVVVAWQGGEPTMMGLDFFRRASGSRSTAPRADFDEKVLIRSPGTAQTLCRPTPSCCSRRQNLAAKRVLAGQKVRAVSSCRLARRSRESAAELTLRQPGPVRAASSQYRTSVRCGTPSQWDEIRKPRRSQLGLLIGWRCGSPAADPAPDGQLHPGAQRS